MPPCRTTLKDKPARGAQVRVLDRRPSRRRTLCHQDQATLRPLRHPEQPTQNVEDPGISFGRAMLQLPREAGRTGQNGCTRRPRHRASARGRFLLCPRLISMRLDRQVLSRGRGPVMRVSCGKRASLLSGEAASNTRHKREAGPLRTPGFEVLDQRVGHLMQGVQGFRCQTQRVRCRTHPKGTAARRRVPGVRTRRVEHLNTRQKMSLERAKGFEPSTLTLAT